MKFSTMLALAEVGACHAIEREFWGKIIERNTDLAVDCCRRHMSGMAPPCSRPWVADLTGARFVDRARISPA